MIDRLLIAYCLAGKRDVMKLLVVVVALLVVAVSANPYADDCGPKERVEFRQQWTDVYGIGDQRIQLGQDIFNKYVQ